AARRHDRDRDARRGDRVAPAAPGAGPRPPVDAGDADPGLGGAAGRPVGAATTRRLRHGRGRHEPPPPACLRPGVASGARRSTATALSGGDTMDQRIELIFVPVRDTDAAKAFYVDTLGWHSDHDQRVSDELRFVQVTPPGSACSIAFGEGISEDEPGSLRSV